MAKISKSFSYCLISFIRIYRFAFSLLLGHCCRFHPSCSAYALDAINMHGGIRGSFFAVRRLLRCHPWHPGGLDPVPKRTSSHGPTIEKSKKCQKLC